MFSSLQESLTSKATVLLKNREGTKAAIKIQSRIRGFLVRKSFSLLKKEDISVLRIRSSNYAAVVGGETNYFRYLDNLHVEYILPVREIASKQQALSPGK